LELVARSRIQDERDASPIASGSRATSETRLDRVVHDDRNASIAAEVFIGASDRFGGKIAAMIYRPSHRRDCGAGRRACAGYDALGAARV